MKKVIIVFIGCLLISSSYSQKGSKARSAKSGQYVTKDYAKKNPSTTVVEKNKPESSKK